MSATIEKKSLKNQLPDATSFNRQVVTLHGNETSLLMAVTTGLLYGLSSYQGAEL